MRDPSAAADSTAEIEIERRLLRKAEADIASGWERLRSQQQLLASLQTSARNTTEAERLVQLMRGTLVEWERHRALIEHRIGYLEGQALHDFRRNFRFS